MLALIAVQRHTAASMSARPLRRLQQGVLEEVPITTNPPSKSAQTPSFRVSIGQARPLDGVGVGLGLGAGVGFLVGGQYVAVTKEKKRRLNATKSAADAVLLHAIS
ncbi:hypothetical protein ACHQM5_001011 [Ranunculus cassubicifolius]